MKKRMWARIISGALAGVMMMTMFAGCNNKKEEEQGIQGSATDMSYNSEGKFTTVVTAEDVSFPEDISAESVYVGYFVMDEKALDKALAAEGDKEESDVNLDDYSTEVTTSVDSVARKDEHTLEIAFSDGKAAENKPSGYGIAVKGKKDDGKDAVLAKANVVYPEYILIPNVKSVSALDQEVRLTLELNEGEYADGISKEDITLSGSFANLTVADLSASGKNLTMQLTGEIVKHESSNAYLDGGVCLDSSAVVDSAKPIEVFIPVDDVAVSLDAAKLTAENGKVTVPILLGGYRFTDKAAAGSFKIDSASISEFEKKSDTEGVLTLNVSGTKDKNSAAAALDGKNLTIAADAVGSSEALTVEADLGSADFYPVFDYAEEKDGKYNMTLILYANAGTFAESLENGMVSFADDFKDASVVFITRTGDATAELKITLPSNGVSVEEMNLNGTVKLAAGALVNRWGDKAAETAYTREYSQTSMDRLFTEMEVGQIKDIVGGFGNTTWGTIFSVGSGFISGATGVYSALEMIGVIESQKAKLDKIYDAIMDLHDNFSGLSMEIDGLRGDMAGVSIGDFYTDKLMMLAQYRKYALGKIQNAQKQLKNLDVAAPAESPEKDAEAWSAYMSQVMKQVADNDRDGTFTFLKNYFTIVYTAVTTTSSGNVLDSFDKYMTYYYNFDTSAYDDREAFRTAIQFEMLNTYFLLCSYYQYSDEDTYTIQELTNQYEKLNSVMEQKAVQRRTKEQYRADSAYMYATKREIYISNQFRWTKNDDWEIKLTDSEIAEFNRRLHGRTIRQDLQLAGYGTSGKTRLVLDSEWDKTYCFFYYSYEVEVDYCNLDDKSITRKTEEIYDSHESYVSFFPTEYVCFRAY